MLPVAHRLTRSADITAVLRAARGGRGAGRWGSPRMVVHAAAPATRTGCPPRVAFVVSKAVGGAVQRNRTRRRLRAAVAAHLPTVAAGLDLVVRAQPTAAEAAYADLDRDLGRALRQLSARLVPSAGAGPAGQHKERPV